MQKNEGENEDGRWGRTYDLILFTTQNKCSFFLNQSLAREPVNQGGGYGVHCCANSDGRSAREINGDSRTAEIKVKPSALQGHSPPTPMLFYLVLRSYVTASFIL